MLGGYPVRLIDVLFVQEDAPERIALAIGEAIARFLADRLVIGFVGLVRAEVIDEEARVDAVDLRPVQIHVDVEEVIVVVRGVT